MNVLRLKKNAFRFPFLIVTCLLVFNFSPRESMAAQEIIRGFNLQYCNKNKCTFLNTNETLRSHLDQIYVFAEAKIVTSSKDQQGKIIRRVFLGKEGYYDPNHNRVVLRYVNNSQKEMMMNLVTGRLIYFN